MAKIIPSRRRLNSRNVDVASAATQRVRHVSDL
jgi:hypothetical protein